MALIALCFAAGIAVSSAIRNYSFSALAAADALMMGAAFLSLRRNRPVQSLGVGLAAIAVSGLLMALAHRDGFSDSDLRSLIAHHAFPLNEPVRFEGCVIEDGFRRGNETVATIELRAFLRGGLWIPCEGKGILRITLPAKRSSAESSVDLARGDKIRAWAVWQKPRNYENPGSTNRVALLARRGIFVIGRTKSVRLIEVIPDGESNAWTRFAAATAAHVRNSLSPIADRGKGQPAAILASLLIGDYSGLNKATREIFQNSGTYHVLVVSGLHVAWIAGLLLQFLKLLHLPERPRYLLAALVILLYTCVVGFQASITRCLWMFLLYMAARIIFRYADTVNILFTAALFLLVAQPDWLFETGFQLSFLAIMAITLTAAPALRKYLQPFWTPIAHSGKPQCLYLQPGTWHRRGRQLRAQCEVLIEEVTDLRPWLSSRLLLWLCRLSGLAGLAITGIILTSVSIQLWLEPLLALNFNRISWISPLANLFIVPISSIVLSAGIAACILSGLPVLGPVALTLAAFLASVLLNAAIHVTSLYGAWQRCPTPGTVWVLCGILLLFLWSFFEWKKFWIPCLYSILLLSSLSVISTPPLGDLWRKCRKVAQNPNAHLWRKEASIFRLTFLDVGEGDSIAIRFPNEQTWLLDAGGLRLGPSYEENAYAFDIGEAVVSRYLWQEWIPVLDRLILSHSDQDHAGGIPAVMRNFRVLKIAYAENKPDPVLKEILSVAGERRISASHSHAGMKDQVGSVAVQVLHPPPKSTLGSSNENSIVLKLSYGSFSALLTGDLEKAGERELLSTLEDLHSDLLKVAHHGSRWGTSHALLDRTRPRWAVISSGRGNPFGHPSTEVMSRLQRHGVRPLLTSTEGAITFETDGNRYILKGHVRGILEEGYIR